MKTIELNVEAKDFPNKVEEALLELNNPEWIHFLLITHQPVNQLSKGAILGILFSQIANFWKPEEGDFHLLLQQLESNLSEEALKENFRENFKIDWEWQWEEKTPYEEKSAWNNAFSERVNEAFEEDEPDYSNIPVKEKNPDFNPWKKER